MGEGNGLVPYGSPSGGMLILRGGRGWPGEGPLVTAPAPCDLPRGAGGDSSRTLRGGSPDSSTNDWKDKRMFVLGNLKVHLQNNVN